MISMKSFQNGNKTKKRPCTVVTHKEEAKNNIIYSSSYIYLEYPYNNNRDIIKQLPNYLYIICIPIYFELQFLILLPLFYIPQSYYLNYIKKFRILIQNKF